MRSGWIYHQGPVQESNFSRQSLYVLFQGYDIIEDMYSPKTSATNFVHELCTCRAKENLAPLLQLVTSTFDVFSVRTPVDALEGELWVCLEDSILPMREMSSFCSAVPVRASALWLLLCSISAPLSDYCSCRHDQWSGLDAHWN